MNFKIHRGTKEIGGSCVEVWTSNTRIIIDMGMPLVDVNRDQFNFKQYENLTTKELIKQKILPDIKGFYDNNQDLVAGILISHPHLDHFGLMNYVSNNIKTYLGEATHKIIEISNIFTHSNYQIINFAYFKKVEPFHIGDFKITPYWNDHSAFDSYSFLIEANGKSIFYSGDFRAHGRKSKAFKWFLHHAPRDVDYLLLEGTTIGRKIKKDKTEIEIEDELFEVFSDSQKINLVYAAGQNIDRLVSIFIAAQKANKLFVIDVYIAKILTELSKFAKLPYPSNSFSNIRVMYPYYSCKKLKDDGNEKVFYQFKKYRITKEDISKQSDKIVMLVRPSMKKDLEHIEGLQNGNLIYSMWEGYLQRKYTNEFIDFLKNLNFSIYNIHSSGHADIEALQKMVNAIRPKNIIPIHTFESDSYQNIFRSNIIQCNDGDVINV
ncbi:MAG: MBL fold metallo-hydrolase [Candidatus Cloacimonetes bacterium]|nr:MBL fold metallo-hydrolase [Candidatus Cloacimonadota bacterium]